jgi:hypothetical protein
MVFDVTGNPDSPNLTARVTRQGTYVGIVDLSPDVRAGRITYAPVVADAAAGMRSQLDELSSKVRVNKWAKIYYDSGHTVADERVFSMRHRSMSFAGWEWQTFSEPIVDISREKPDNLNHVGRADGRSLFDWVHRNWDYTATGWLACDDGAGEIADFIHLDTAQRPPVLTLIHVKAAKRADHHRQTSVGRYDIVATQAIKNLRFLDRIVAVDGLAAGARRAVAELVWKDRRAQPRQELLNVLDDLGDDHLRKVVIVQPHQRRSVYEAPKSAAEQRRIDQLNNLLLSADASCRGVQAEFVVVGDDT